jgi:hypothetical protein
VLVLPWVMTYKGLLYPSSAQLLSGKCGAIPLPGLVPTAEESSVAGALHCYFGLCVASSTGLVMEQWLHLFSHSSFSFFLSSLCEFLIFAACLCLFVLGCYYGIFNWESSLKL